MRPIAKRQADETTICVVDSSNSYVTKVDIELVAEANR